MSLVRLAADDSREGVSSATDLFAPVKRLLAHIRHVSGQASISTMISFISQYSLSSIPQPILPTVHTGGRGQVKRYLVDWAVTAEPLAVAGSRELDEAPPTPDVMLLDAITALQSEDYRRAVLYAAIAIESGVSVLLEEAYAKVLSRLHLSAEYRVRETLVHADAVRRLDPIYQFLKGRRKFRSLLHEEVLYLCGRSLQYDDKDLYDRAVRLYETRNRLAHRGDVPAVAPHVRLDESGARDAIDCAVRVIAWARRSPYSMMLPSTEFVPMEPIDHDSMSAIDGAASVS